MKSFLTEKDSQKNLQKKIVGEDLRFLSRVSGMDFTPVQQYINFYAVFYFFVFQQNFDLCSVD